MYSGTTGRRETVLIVGRPDALLMIAMALTGPALLFGIPAIPTAAIAEAARFSSVMPAAMAAAMTTAAVTAMGALAGTHLVTVTCTALLVSCADLLFTPDRDIATRRGTHAIRNHIIDQALASITGGGFD